MIQRALIVEDDEHIAALLRIVLEEERYQVETTADPDSALSILRSGRFDIALVDQLQAGISTLEEEPRQWLSEVARLCPTILITARCWVLRMSADARTSLAHELGLCAILPKPFEIGGLMNLLDTTSGRARRPLPQLMP